MDSYFHVFARLPEDTRARTAVINDEMLRTFSKTDASAAAQQPPPEGAGGGEPHALGLGEWKSLLSALGLVPGLVSPLDMVDIFQQTAVACSDDSFQQAAAAHTTVASVTAAGSEGRGLARPDASATDSDGPNAPTITPGGGVDGGEDTHIYPARPAPVAAVSAADVARAGGLEDRERRLGLTEYRRAVRRLAQRLHVTVGDLARLSQQQDSSGARGGAARARPAGSATTEPSREAQTRRDG